MSKKDPSKFFCNGPARRLMASLMAMMFTLTSLYLGPAQAAADSPTAFDGMKSFPAELASFSVPLELGKIEATFKGSGPQTVVLIQDAHSLPEAQKSIQGILARLSSVYGLRVTALEGSVSRLDPRFLKSFPNIKILEKVLEEFSAEGEVPGPAAAAILNKDPMNYYGIEDWPLYEKGVSLFNRAVNREAEVSAELEAVRRQLDALKKKVYSKDLLAFDAALNEFHSNKINIGVFLKDFLKWKAPEKGSDLEILAKEISESEMREGSLQAALETYAGQLQSYFRENRAVSGNKKQAADFQERYQAWRVSQMTGQAFAEYLDQVRAGTGFDQPLPANLTAAASRQRRIEAIEGAQFFEAFDAWLTAVEAKLAVTPEARDLAGQSKTFYLLEQLSRMELSSEAWMALQHHFNAGSSQPLFDSLWKSLAVHREFYEAAQTRDEVFLKHLQSLMKKEKVSSLALVVGGFHAQALMSELKKANISYALVMPAIAKLPEVNRYRQHMQGEVSFRDYFEAEKGKVSIYKAFIRAARDKLLSSQQFTGPHPGKNKESGDSQEGPQTVDYRLAKEWRDAILRDLAADKKLDRAWEYTRFIDEVTDKIDSAGFHAQWMANIDQFIEGLRQLQFSKQLDAGHMMNLLPAAPAVSTFLDLTGGILSPGALYPVSMLPTGRLSFQERTQKVRSEVRSEAHTRRLNSGPYFLKLNNKSMHLPNPSSAEALPGSSEPRLDLSPQKKKVLVVGAGAYGAHVAAELAESGELEVTLVEKQKDLLTGGASYKGQGRIHDGYELPRTPGVAREAKENRPFFEAAYKNEPGVFRRHYNHIYAVSSSAAHKNKQPLTGDEYKRFLNDLDLPMKEVEPPGVLNPENLDLVIRVGEAFIDIPSLREVLRARLDKSGVHRMFGTEATEELLNGYDFVVFTTYAAINQFGPALRSKFTVHEQIIVRLPPQYRNLAVSFIDGAHIEPLDEELHIMGYASQTTHHQNIGLYPELPEKNREKYKAAIAAPGMVVAPELSYFDRIVEFSKPFFADDFRPEYVGSYFVIKTLPQTENDNSESPLVKVQHAEGENRAYVLGGKMTSAPETARKVAAIVKQELSKSKSARQSNPQVIIRRGNERIYPRQRQRSEVRRQDLSPHNPVVAAVLAVMPGIRPVKARGLLRRAFPSLRRNPDVDDLRKSMKKAADILEVRAAGHPSSVSKQPATSANILSVAVHFPPGQVYSAGFLQGFLRAFDDWGNGEIQFLYSGQIPASFRKQLGARGILPVKTVLTRRSANVEDAQSVVPLLTMEGFKAKIDESYRPLRLEGAGKVEGFDQQESLGYNVGRTLLAGAEIDRKYSKLSEKEFRLQLAEELKNSGLAAAAAAVTGKPGVFEASLAAKIEFKVHARAILASAA